MIPEKPPQNREEDNTMNSGDNQVLTQQSATKGDNMVPQRQDGRKTCAARKKHLLHVM